MRPASITLTLLLLAAAARPSAVHAGGEREARAAAITTAARALFDEAVPRETLERLAREHYLPALERHGSSIVTAPMVVTDEVTPGTWEWLRAEPAARLRLCAALVDELTYRDEIDAAYAACQAGALRAAGADLTTQRAADVQNWIARDIARDDEHPQRQAALAALARNARLDEEHRRSARAAELAAVRRSGKRVLFGQVAVDSWQPFRKTSERAPSCQGFALLAVPPAVRARDGFDLTVSVGGQACHSEVVFGAAERELSEICGDHAVLRPGENRVQVTISKNVNRASGVRWDPEQWRDVRTYSNRPGKRLATAEWRCTISS